MAEIERENVKERERGGCILKWGVPVLISSKLNNLAYSKAVKTACALLYSL